MSKTTLWAASAFVGTWAVAHAFYAFVMLDWSPLTEWEPASRGLILSLALYASFCTLPLTVWRKKP